MPKPMVQVMDRGATTRVMATSPATRGGAYDAYLGGAYDAYLGGAYDAYRGGAYDAYRGSPENFSGTSVPYDAGGPGWNDFQLQGR